MNKKMIVCGALPLALAGGAQAEETWGDKLYRMVKDGKASLDFRYRYETVDQDPVDGGTPFEDDAEAALLRSRLTLETAQLNGFSILAEFEDVRNYGPDDYNSTENGKTEYPIIADPEGTDVNQAWIRYNADKWDGTVGRQRINHGNQRFVGGVAWRQNEQTFNGVRANVKAIDGLNVDLSYLYNIKRVFGPDDGDNPADLEGDHIFLRADYDINEHHKLAAFGYVLDVDDQGAYPPSKTVNLSSDTFGLEYSGTIDRFSIFASWANQGDGGDSELDYDADYYVVELGGDFDIVKVKIGYEVLGSDDNEAAFQTPVATLHKFQGWADKFLTTPPDGVEDFYVDISGKVGPVKLAAVYHEFQTNEDPLDDALDSDYGSEIDLVATWAVNKQFSVQAKYASFDSDETARLGDTDKIWFTLQLTL